MNGEDIFGLAIMLGVCLGCGILFFGIGIWADRSEKPFGFWAGQDVKAESISDIPAYNRENGTMWKIYSAPYFLCCACYAAGIWVPLLRQLSIVLLFAAGTLGIWWLIRQYRLILGKYSVK